MWTAVNQLKGILKFPGLGVEFAPGAECDLDTIGREKAEASVQLRIAFENGYLKTVRKSVMLDESELSRLIETRIQSIKSNLVTEISEIYKDRSAAPA
ncbi:MAG: hypothetical protein HYY16_06980 [Planctomycetes bacterium]|nr:hypothetical protein [Planctomycetota bacterium]